MNEIFDLYKLISIILTNLLKIDTLLSALKIVATTLDNRSPTSNPRSVTINQTNNNIIGTRVLDPTSTIVTFSLHLPQ